MDKLSGLPWLDVWQAINSANEAKRQQAEAQAAQAEADRQANAAQAQAEAQQRAVDAQVQAEARRQTELAQKYYDDLKAKAEADKKAADEAAAKKAADDKYKSERNFSDVKQEEINRYLAWMPSIESEKEAVGELFYHDSMDSGEYGF